MMIKPLVSVITITYNNAPYIVHCIEGVLMQKTTFPFELVIGEDCSTDGTREIVFKYVEQYPDIIRVITSETNVGMKENFRRTFNAYHGEYIALCEGDDYWIDPLKLQKQYEAVIHYDVVFVTHKTIELIMQNGEVIGTRLRGGKGESGYIKPEQIILKNINIQDSSFFVKKTIFEQLPEWYYQSPVLDIPLKMIAASLGKVYFIDEIMSVYLHGTPGSWTDRNRNPDKHDPKLFKFIRDYLVMCKNFDQFCGYKYHEAVRELSQNFLIKQIFVAGNREYLNIPENQKPAIDLIVYLSRFFPRRLKKTIQRMVASYLVDSIYI